MKVNTPCSSFSHWNALELWNFLYMGPLRTEKAIIHQDGRGSSSPKAKGHIEGLWVDLLVKLNVVAPPEALRAAFQLYLVYFSGITIGCEATKWFSLFFKCKVLSCGVLVSGNQISLSSCIFRIWVLTVYLTGPFPLPCKLGSLPLSMVKSEIPCYLVNYRYLFPDPVTSLMLWACCVCDN